MTDITPSLKELNQKLDEHISEYNRRESNLLEAQALNTKHIAELTKATKGLVDAWNTAKSLQKFVRWVTGFSGIAALIVWWHDIIKFIDKP